MDTINEEVSEFDYTLSFDFPRCSVVELHGIAQCLLLCSSMCLGDFYDLIGEMILRMRSVGVALRNVENSEMANFILILLNTLKKMNRGYPPTQLIILLEKEYNMFMGIEILSPVISPVTSPGVKLPKIMKKVRKN
jgi:hypothetical protein